jgi:hypothetical protein
VDVPFLIEGRGSSVTIVEPSDEEVRRKAYWVFPYAEGGYAITRERFPGSRF